MTWNEFRESIRAEAPASSRYAVQNGQGAAHMLFRGHADSRWGLDTTLERAGHSNTTIQRYMHDCGSARRYMGNIVPCEIPFDSQANCSYQNASTSLPNYESVAFLRHHGFPSPLLDWTESPFVAAFFAFRNIPDGVASVAIFGYRSYANHVKDFSSSHAAIFTMGPFASIHERHIAQQCQYTYCIKADGDQVTFRPHEECISRTALDFKPQQDVVTKWEIDATERKQVLADLFQMNITPFSLFRTIDGAAETAALRIL
jgi:hypothetical protein